MFNKYATSHIKYGMSQKQTNNAIAKKIHKKKHRKKTTGQLMAQEKLSGVQCEF